MQRLLPTCVFSKLPASKVCLHPLCDQIPFLCQGQCVAHACTKLHKHNGQYKLMNLQSLKDLIHKLQNPNKTKDQLIQSVTQSLTQIIESLKLMIQRFRKTMQCKDMQYRCSSVHLATILKINQKEYSKLTGKQLSRLVNSKSSQNQMQIQAKIKIENGKVTNVIDSIHQLLDYYHGSFDFREKSQKFLSEAIRISSLQPRDSLLQYSKSIEFNPNNSVAILGRAETYSRLEMYDESLKDYKRVIQLDPNNHIAHNSLGIILNDHFSKPKQSIKSFTTAIQINPIQVTYFLNRCNAYIQLGNFHMALKDITECINKNPNQPWFHLKRAQIQQKLGLKKQADQDLRMSQVLKKRNSKKQQTDS